MSSVLSVNNSLMLAPPSENSSRSSAMLVLSLTNSQMAIATIVVGIEKIRNDARHPRSRSVATKEESMKPSEILNAMPLLMTADPGLLHRSGITSEERAYWVE